MGQICYCILAISGEKLEFQLVEDHLGIAPTMTIDKGTTTDEYTIEVDKWIYEDESSYTDPQMALEQIIIILQPSKDYILELAKLNNISIRCSINSNLAQIGFDLTPKVLGLISELGIQLEISILSWGEVEDEDGERCLITDLFPTIIREEKDEDS